METILIVLCSLTYALMGLYIALKSIALWSKENNSHQSATILYPYTTLVNHQFHRYYGMLWYRQKRFTAIDRSPIFDFFIHEEFKPCWTGKLYILLHVLFWPIRLLMNLGIYLKYRKPRTITQVVRT